MRISQLLQPQHIFLNIPVHTREEVLAYVAEHLERSGSVSRALDLIDQLLDRERLGATIVGDETAVPHCKVPGLREVVTAFARSHDSVRFGEDLNHARMFFFVLSPPEQPVAHLRVLSSIARLLRDPAVRRSFLEAPNGEELLATVAAFESRS